ncbi:unnamed protein product [Spirodela intermedia]|uniref:Uncharacterized protein n=2 Tax=Spirodela intermedia TaxID=51605 RepID=A0A7I8JYB2_SPIIN|nr:unnamed protein product [Spirodela intermedia]CAA6653918.1 unnamed protein product [Spirodela intermedia]CAA7388351.1 unnamed protein product [Spirodela intermedia]
MATNCINDSQWRIGSFLTNCSSPKKIRWRNKKINFGSNQQPDCVVIMDADRKSSVIQEADRSQIPIASSVDSTNPFVVFRGSFSRIVSHFFRFTLKDPDLSNPDPSACE